MKIELADYDAAWPGLYQRERARVLGVLPGAELEHVGSTSVSGLCAKPVVDMMLVVDDAADEGAEVGGGAEAGAAGDDVEAGLPQFDEAAGEGDAFAGEPGQWCGAELGLEAAVQGRGADGGSGGQVGDGERLVEVVLGPGQQGCEGFVGQVGHGAFDELSLAAVAVGGEDEPAADGVGDLGAVVAADEVQAEVEGGGAAGGGEDVAVVDEEHVGFEVHGGEPGAEVLGPLPVGGGAAAVEDAGFGEGEGAAAEADEAGAAGVGAADGVEDGRAAGCVDVGPVGDDEGVGGVGGGEVGDAGEGEEAVAHGGVRFGCAELEVVEVAADLGAGEAEDLGGAAEFEGVGVLVDDHDDTVRGFLRHVRFLALTLGGR